MAPWRTSLPIERTRPSSARWAIAAGGVVHASGAGAQHDHTTGVPHLTNPGVKERPCLAELIARADPGGVEHERLERLARRDEVGADRFEERLECAGVVRGGGGAEQHRAFDHWLPRLIALELYR